MMTKEELTAINQFLQRATIQATEIPAFNSIVAVIQREFQELVSLEELALQKEVPERGEDSNNGSLIK